MLKSVPDRSPWKANRKKICQTFAEHSGWCSLNMITLHRLTSHKTALSRLERKHPSRSRNRTKIKNRNQQPVHPKRMLKGSVHLAPRWTCPLLAPMTLATKNQSHHCFPYISSCADFSGLSSLLGFSLSFFTTSYSVFLLPINDKEKKSIHLLNDWQWNKSLQRLKSR